MTFRWSLCFKGLHSQWICHITSTKVQQTSSKYFFKIQLVINLLLATNYVGVSQFVWCGSKTEPTTVNTQSRQLIPTTQIIHKYVQNSLTFIIVVASNSNLIKRLVPFQTTARINTFLAEWLETCMTSFLFFSFYDLNLVTCSNS